MELLKGYEIRVDKLMVDFVEILLTSARDIHPAIDKALQSLRDNILGLRTMLKEEAATIFEGINSAAKEAHRAVKPEIVASWEGIYEQCGDECGKGLFHRNKKAHRNHVKGDGGAAMYKRAGDAIRKALNKVLDNLQEQFDMSYSEAANQLQEDLDILVERHSASPVKTALSLDASLAKERLRKALQPHFEQLEKAWGLDSDVVKMEVEESEQNETVPLLAAEEEQDMFAFNPDDWA